MDREKALDRVRKLLAIVTDPSQVNEKGEPNEQARTSAFIACMYIENHKLLEAAPAPRPAPAPKPAPPPGPWKKRYGSRRSKVRTPTVEDLEFAKRYGGNGAKVEAFGGRRGTFTYARHHDRCLYCGFAIQEGDEIYLMPGFGSDHTECAMKRAGLHVE